MRREDVSVVPVYVCNWCRKVCSRRGCPCPGRPFRSEVERPSWFARLWMRARGWVG